MKYKVFCDGASRSNPGEAAIGVSIQIDGKEIHTISKARLANSSARLLFSRYM